MLKNYFKIAIAVLMRRKFFTFVSLFGISLTLTVLLVLTSFFDKMFSPNYPDYDRNKSLHISKVAITNTKEGWYNGSAASFHLVETIASKMKTPQKVSIYTFSSSSDTYINNKKLSLDYKFTDAAFWEVTMFKFLEGKPYLDEDIRTAQKVAVITDRTRKNYFNDEPAVTGKFIELDNVSYRVIGVVKGSPQANKNFHSDVYLPYTVSKTDPRRLGKSDLVKISLVDQYMGGFGAVLVAKSEDQIPLMRRELNQMLKRMFKPAEGYDKIYVNADTPLEAFSRNVVGGDDSPNIGKLILYGSLLIILFLLLPAINLININITRIMERSSEIGVRKAFGATSKTLVYQFIVENLILTVIGGIVGTVLAMLVIYFYNNSGMQPDINLTINYRVLGVGLVLCLFFGLLSGVYPAWRMSRLNLVHALKSK